MALKVKRNELEKMTTDEICNWYETNFKHKEKFFFAKEPTNDKYGWTTQEGTFEKIRQSFSEITLKVLRHTHAYRIGESAEVEEKFFFPVPDFVYQELENLVDEGEINEEDIFFNLLQDLNSFYDLIDAFTDDFSSDIITFNSSFVKRLINYCFAKGYIEEEKAISFTSSVKEELLSHQQKTVETTTKITEEKGEQTMFKGMSLFKGMDKIDTSKVKMTMFGLGVENEQGVVQTYNATTEELTDVSDFVIEGFGSMSDMVFVFPAQKVLKGDLVVFNGSICHVVAINGTRIKAVDFNSNQEVSIIKQRHALGFNFVPKIMCPFGNMFTAVSKDPVGGMESMLPMMMMMNMGKDEKGGSMSSMMEMMMMSQMFGGQNPFASMFGGLSAESTDDEESSEE